MGARLSFEGKHKFIGLDAAPFIYYIEDVAPYTDLLDPVFNLLENNALHAFTSTVTFAEILTKPFPDKNFSLADEIKLTLKSLSSLSVVGLTRSWGEAAALIRARHTIRLPDALQVAAAIQGEAALFSTNDKRIKKVDALEWWSCPTFFKAEYIQRFAFPFTGSLCPLVPARRWNR